MTEPMDSPTKGNWRFKRAKRFNRKNALKGQYPRRVALSLCLLIGLIVSGTAQTNQYFRIINKIPSIPVLSEDPEVDSAGALYFNNTDGTLRCFNGNKWIVHGVLSAVPTIPVLSANPDVDAEGSVYLNKEDGTLRCFDGKRWHAFGDVYAPSISSLSVIGVPVDSYTLRVNYEYHSPAYKEQGPTVLQWYYAQDSKGTGKTAIEGANQKEYTLKNDDGCAVGTYVALGITPADSDSLKGTEVMSEWQEVKSEPYCPWDSIVVKHTIKDDITPTEAQEGRIVYRVVYSELSGEHACWITKNLGAIKEATTATSTSDDSKGWFFQFNRKQSYYATGTYGSNIVPEWNSTKVTDNNDWLADNDPCRLLLGDGWHIPTRTQWENTMNNGGWGGSSNTVFNQSVLKLHLPGVIKYVAYSDTDVKIEQCGYWGQFWSCSSQDTENAYMAYISSSGTKGHTTGQKKTEGNSVRCIYEVDW